MRRVFVDSGGFFACLVAEDDCHARAAELFQGAKEEGWHLVTTNAVVFETHALLVNRVRDGRRIALRYLDSLSAGLCRIERVTKRDETRAVEPLTKHDDKNYSFCDALSFIVMERLRIKETIAFDRHFREYGRLTIL